jgi:hypothetical protein
MHFSTFTVLAVMAVAVSAVPAAVKPSGMYASLPDLWTYISSDDLIIVEDGTRLALLCYALSS